MNALKPSQSRNKYFLPQKVYKQESNVFTFAL